MIAPQSYFFAVLAAALAVSSVPGAQSMSVEGITEQALGRAQLADYSAILDRRGEDHLAHHARRGSAHHHALKPRSGKKCANRVKSQVQSQGANRDDSSNTTVEAADDVKIKASAQSDENNEGDGSHSWWKWWKHQDKEGQDQQGQDDQVQSAALSQSGSDSSSSSPSAKFAASSGANRSSSSGSSGSSGKSSGNSSGKSFGNSGSGNYDASNSSSIDGSVTTTAGSGNYQRHQANRGNQFWSNGAWRFFSYPDPTHGSVDYQTEENAKRLGLIGMKDGAAVMRTSQQDLAPGQNRPSVRFESIEAYDSGLIIFDVVKMPLGCATWPALWTVGPGWPSTGEIDVMEGTGYTSNGRNANQMTIHLNSDSPLQMNRRAEKTKRSVASSLGRLVDNASNCNQWGAHTGCAFFDSNGNGPSWGEEFNNAGGGIWAMQFGNGGGVKVWFWGRESGKIPEALQDPGNSPRNLDPSSFGQPMANFQSPLINSAIRSQQIIMDITIGGDWAGNVPMDGHCANQDRSTAYAKGSNYNDAEFIINAIDIYCLNGNC